MPSSQRALPQSTSDHEKQQMMSMSKEHRPHDGPPQKIAFPRWRTRGKEKSTIAALCSWVVDHQISISLTLLSVLFSTHFSFPDARHHTRKFFRISYYNPQTGLYALGWDDIWFVFYWIIVCTGARCSVMDYILVPTARWAGISKKKAQIRFAEQAWMVLCYGMLWCFGMRLLVYSDYWLDLRALWRNWPIREMDGLAKWYYLVELAFWLQQIVVVNIEERRKDHWQMFTHHLVTCALIFTSYGYHQSRVGHLFLVIMDPSDILLSGAKILKYLGFQLLCDVAFGLFIAVWFITRHIIYLTVCWSIYKHIPEEISYGCYSGDISNLQGPNPVPDDWNHLMQPFYNPAGLVCWNNNIKWVFLGLLLALHGLIEIWFTQIIRVAYKVLSGQGADDVRSDDEDEDDEDEEDEDEEILNTVPTEKQGHLAPNNNNISKSHNLNSTDLHPDTKSSHPTAFIEQEVLSTDPSQHQYFSSDARHSGGSSSSSRSSKLRSGSSKPKSSPVRKSSRRKENGHSSSVNLLAGSNGDRKELLGRIGCDKSSSE